MIVGLGEKPVPTSAEFFRGIAASKPGIPVNIAIVRKAQRQVLSVKIGERVAGAAPRASGRAARAGLDVTELSSDEKRLLNLERGLIVRDADDAALRGGIRPDDLILAVNDVAVADIATFDRLLAEHAGRMIALRIRRGNDTIYVPLRLNARAS